MLSSVTRSCRSRALTSLLVFVAAIIPAASQTAPSQSAELTSTLRRLGEAAAALQTNLPNFECIETVISRRTLHDKEKRRVDMTATLRAKRDSAGKLEESFEPHTLDNKPVSMNSEKVNMPLYVRGGFTSTLNLFDTESQACLSYTLSPGRIDFQGHPGPSCELAPGVRGFALLDSDGKVTHTERQIPADIAKEHKMAPDAAVDIAPVEMNGRTYRLSSHLVSSWPNGKYLDRFEVTYSGCHLFSTKATIVSGPTVIPGDTPETAPK